MGENKNDWVCGYYCAVAILLKIEGRVTPTVEDLFNGSKKSVMEADQEDIELFKEYGLVKE